MDETTVETPAVENTGIKANASTFGWQPNPIIEKLNADTAARHAQEAAPAVQAVMKVASPNATGEDRLKAANVLKSANESKPEDVIRSVLNLNPADLYVALTGGSDRREEAIDSTGNLYYKVYNSRQNPANPAGELRRIEDALGNVLSDKQRAEVGPLTSKSDITAERSARFIANGQAFVPVAQANSQNYVNLQKSGAAAAIHGTGITDLANQVNELGQKLGKYSLSPDTLQKLSGVSSIRTGNTQQIQNATERIKQFLSTNGTNEGWKKTVDDAGGFNLGLQFKEGQGLFFGNEKISKAEDLDRVAKTYANTQSSSENIERRRNDMLAEAQIAATKIDPKNRSQALADMNDFINKNAQIALMQNEVEKAGGVPGAKPNIPHQLGDSFQSGTLKAISDRAYGETANLWAQFINEKRAQLPAGAVPPMGQWEAEFANSASLKDIKTRAKADSLAYLKKSQPEMEQLSVTPAQALSTPTIAAAAPPPAAGPVVSENVGKPAPKKSAPPPPASKSKKSLADIFK
jgi:hypothetical protein